MARLIILSAFLLGACTTVPPSHAGLGSTAAPAQAMVSAADPRAAAAGVIMLKRGGSAFDAAAATLLALSVVEPQSSGIGGGGFLIYQAAGNSEPTSFDGRETAPASATPRWFFDADGKVLGGDQAKPGGKSVGVPGNIAMLALAHAKYGKLPWATLFEPAIVLARDGFDITPRMAAAIARQAANLARTREGAAIFLNPDGSPKLAGTHLINTPLAQTFELIAAKGPIGFYTGPNADALVATVNTAGVNPSSMTRADVTAYQAKQRPAVCGKYHSYRICSMGPPSSGGLALIAILQQLDRFDLRKLGADSPVAWHLLAESERLAFADRAIYGADSDFVSVPVAGLLDAKYLRQRSNLIDPASTMASVNAGKPTGAPARVLVADGEVPSTSHFSAVDGFGNVASLTSTVEGAFGSGLVSGGYVLNNELTDFNLSPVVDGALVANRVQGGKRPRSSMSPAIVYDAKGRVVLSVGAAGGPTIPAQTAKNIIAVLDWQLSIADAIALPVLMMFEDRIIVEATPQGDKLAAMIPALTALGHKNITRFALPYKANGIERIPGGWRGGADPRSEGAAVGF